MTQVSPSVIILNMPLLPLAFYFRIVQGALESNSPDKLCVHTGLFLSEAAMLAGCFFTFYTHWERERERDRNNCGSRRAHFGF